jgi:hypothetical protein
MDSDGDDNNDESVIIEIQNDLDNEILEEIEECEEVQVKERKKEVLEEDEGEFVGFIDSNCPICADMMTPPMLLGCGHNLCIRCWRKTASIIDGIEDFNRSDRYTKLLDVVECPQCRKSFDIEEWMMAGLDCIKHRYIKQSMGQVEYYNSCHIAFGFARTNPAEVPFGIGYNAASWFNYIRETVPIRPQSPSSRISDDDDDVNSIESLNDNDDGDDDGIVDHDINDEEDLGIALNRRRKGKKRKPKRAISYNWLQSCYRGCNLWLGRSAFVVIDHLEKLVRLMFFVCMVIVPFLFAVISSSCLVGAVYVVHKLISNPNGGLFIETWSGMASFMEVVILLAMSVFFGFYSLRYFADLFARWKNVREQMIKKLAEQGMVYLPTTIANNDNVDEILDRGEDIIHGPANGGYGRRTMNNRPPYVGVGYAGVNPARGGVYYGRRR